MSHLTAKSVGAVDKLTTQQQGSFIHLHSNPATYVSGVCGQVENTMQSMSWGVGISINYTANFQGGGLEQGNKNKLNDFKQHCIRRVSSQFMKKHNNTREILHYYFYYQSQGVSVLTIKQQQKAYILVVYHSILYYDHQHQFPQIYQHM